MIVDEAHSSQTGEAAKDLRLALGATDEQELTVGRSRGCWLHCRGHRPGRRGPGEGRVGSWSPGESVVLRLHCYSQGPHAWNCSAPRTRRARYRALPPVLDAPGHRRGLHPGRSGELHDVPDLLADREGRADDPAYEAPKARRAIAKFVSLHPSNLAQKAEIIVEHFRAHTAAKIGGTAKAMVVTSSRLHAVRYKQAIDAYIHRKGYSDVATLVAFSGRVITDDGSWSEPGMERFPLSLPRNSGHGLCGLLLASQG